MSELYNFEYYHNCCGPVPYEQAEHWTAFFGRVADHIVNDLHPRTVLDAGCAMGYLVAALRDRGVEAYGVDISEYAISKVREDVRPYCAVGSLCESLPETLPERFDLVTCIEVLEHIQAEDGRKAIENLCSLADQVVFSSTPDDFTERTHVNVQQPEYWAKHFAQNGLYHRVGYDLSYLSPNAMLFRREPEVPMVVADYERERRLMSGRLKSIAAYPVQAKVYFDLGQGMSEELCAACPIENGAHIRGRIVLPAGKVRSLRVDPTEGFGCFVWGLRVRTDIGILSVESHNGLYLDGVYAFRTNDPQLYFGTVPENSHWVDIDCEILAFDSGAGAAMIAAAEKLEAEGASLRRQLQEMSEKERADQQQMEKLEAEGASLRQQLEKSAAEGASLQKQLQKMSVRERAGQQQLERLQSSLSKAKAEIEAQTNANQAQLNAHQAQIQDYSALVQYERGEMARVTMERDVVLNSTIWRMSKPLRWTLDHVKRMVPAPIKKTIHSLRENGVRYTARKVAGKLSGKPYQPVPMTVVTSASGHKEHLPTITGNPIEPLQTVLVDEPVKRLNLVTDSIGANSLLGGVATSLIVATEFANRYGYELRIITRNAIPNPADYENIMRISGVEPAEKVSFYSDQDRHVSAVDFKLEISPEDVFFATSWWSCKAIEGTTIRKRFFYIIQEVETFFYNFGSEHMSCAQVMKSENIDFIINSHYLQEYFSEHEPNIVKNGCWFEPAFPRTLYAEKRFVEKDHYKLFFYSRPNNPRNLFAVGVSMLDRAIETGILDMAEWDIYFVGQDVPEVVFCDGSKPKMLGQLSWVDYAHFLGDVDLGLCLMYTPHPSYPPYDVACSGGVVLSNKMMNKTSFEACSNVILADLEEDAFLDSFREAVRLAKDMQTRKRNYESSTICRDWNETLEGVLGFMKERLENV